MPNGVFPVPKYRPTGERQARTWRTARMRLHVWWHRIELDQQLAAGDHPLAFTPLRLRAEQLVTRAERVQMTHALEDVLSAARRLPGGAGIQLRAGEIRACQDDIRALARRLADWRPIDVQGAAMVSLLLTDPSGPLSRAGATSLRYAVRSARLALDHADDSVSMLLDAA